MQEMPENSFFTEPFHRQDSMLQKTKRAWI